MLGSQLLIAFDAASITGARVSRGLGGARLGALSRVVLEPGSLAPGAFAPNVARPDVVRDAVGAVHRGLGANGRRATLIVPDGVARARLLELPHGVEAREYARFALGQGLPYPAGEAVVDGLDLGRGRFLAAAAHRDVLREYEAVAEDAGLRQERLDLAPLAGLAGLARRGGRAGVVDLLLGDVALSLLAWSGDGAAAFHGRRHDAFHRDAAWLASEVARSAREAGLTQYEVRVAGPGARRAVAELAAAGERAAVGGSDEPVDGIDTAELAWLGPAG